MATGLPNTLLGLFRASGTEDPLTDAKSTESWFNRQPANDYLATSEAIVRALEELGARQPKITPGRILAVLELDRLSLPIQARLMKQYLQANLSDSVRQRLWHALDDLARWLAYTYENLFQVLLDSGVGQKMQPQMAGVAARMFYYRGLQGKNALFRYERSTPAKWKGLHGAYDAAVGRGIAQTTFALVDEGLGSERTSAEQEYALILLLYRVNTGNLTAVQIERAAQWLRKWMPMLTLSAAADKEKGDGFWLDLGLGDGLLTRRPHTAQGKMMYLDIEPLQREIGAMLVDLTLVTQRASAAERHGEAAERLSLLQRLESLWRPQAKLMQRRGIRVPADRGVQVAPGLTELAAALRGTNGEQTRIKRFRQGDPVELASGAVQLAVDNEALDFEAHRVTAAWQMQDASESGVKLVSQSAEAGQQRLGSLLGILDEGQTRWKIGIVRRLKKFTGGQTELGVEIVAHHCVLIAPKPVASRNTGYSVDGIDVSAERKSFDALYLPPSNRPGRPPARSMLVPALEFGERRRFFLNFEDMAYTIEITAPIERSKDWVWTGFQVVPEAQ